MDCRIWGPYSGGYEELYLLGYKAVYPVENQKTFQRNMLPSFSGFKNKSIKKPA
jgi:hypothetical protein